jgi:hypothetical protein
MPHEERARLEQLEIGAYDIRLGSHCETMMRLAKPKLVNHPRIWPIPTRQQKEERQPN